MNVFWERMTVLLMQIVQILLEALIVLVIMDI